MIWIQEFLLFMFHFAIIWLPKLYPVMLWITSKLCSTQMPFFWQFCLSSPLFLCLFFVSFPSIYFQILICQTLSGFNDTVVGKSNKKRTNSFLFCGIRKRKMREMSEFYSWWVGIEVWLSRHLVLCVKMSYLRCHDRGLACIRAPYMQWTLRSSSGCSFSRCLLEVFYVKHIVFWRITLGCNHLLLMSDWVFFGLTLFIYLILSFQWGTIFNCIFCPNLLA